MNSKNSVFVSGLFNVLHPGHFRFLEFAKRQGKKLIVGLETDGDLGAQTVPIDVRLRNINALNHVDEALIIEESLEKTLRTLRPEIVVKGWEYRDKLNVEADIVSEYGGKILFSPNDIQITESPFEETNAVLNQDLSNQFVLDFVTRRNLKPSELLETVDSFKKIKLCVIGDLILDRYVQCAAVGMSREDPCIVMKPQKEQLFIGGAGIVACHASSLGASVEFISIMRDDKAGKVCKKKLLDQSVKPHLFIDDTRPTTQKTRYKVDGKTLARVNDFGNHDVDIRIQNQIFERFNSIVDELDVLIFSDFSLGTLPLKLVQRLIVRARKSQVFIAADSQSSSQIGDLKKFIGVDYVTPTEYEARVTLSDQENGLVALTKNLNHVLNCKQISMTLGPAGVLVTQFGEGLPDAHEIKFENDTLPSLNPAPRDISGAGDAFLVVSTISLACGVDIWRASLLGSMAAGIQVSREGNSPIGVEELKSVVAK